MKILKKLLLFDKDLDTKQNMLQLCYRLFTFIIPVGIVLWNLVVEKLLDKDVSIMAKWGCAGTCALIVIALIGVYFIKKMFRKKLEKINDKLLECTDDDKKKELVKKREVTRKWQELFNNACLIAPFVVAYILVCLIEKATISLRGGLLALLVSFGVGFVFNYLFRTSLIKD